MNPHAARWVMLTDALSEAASAEWDEVQFRAVAFDPNVPDLLCEIEGPLDAVRRVIEEAEGETGEALELGQEVGPHRYRVFDVDGVTL